MTTVRKTIDLLAALLVGVTAGWVLLAPPAATFSFGGTDTELTVLAASRPVAAAVGVVLAAVVAGMLSRRGSARATRLVSLAGLVLLVVMVTLVDADGSIWRAVAWTAVAGLSAGVALGGAAAAVSSEVESTLLAAGAMVAFLLASTTAWNLDGPTRGWADYAEGTSSFVAPPPAWLLLPAATATAIALLLGGGRPARAPARGVVATVAVVAGALVTNAAITASPDNRQLTWILLAVLVAVVAAAAIVLDVDGSLLLVAAAVMAAAASLSGLPDTTWAGIVVFAAAFAAGVAAGWRWPGVVAGLTLLAVVPLSGLLPDAVGTMGDAVRWLVLAPVAGYALGSAGGARSGATVAGLSVLFVPSALSVACQSVGSGVLADHAVWTDLPRGSSAVLPPDPQVLSMTMTVVVLATIAAAGVALRRTGESA